MRTFSGVLVLTALVAAGCADQDHSTADSGGSPVTDIEISMIDNRFMPAEVTVPKGRPVTFRFTNDGAVRHEALVGDDRTQNEHARGMMRSSSTMMNSDDMGGMHHAGSDSAVTVDPGDSADITTTFDNPGEYLIGCHQPGHYEAGMKATITVDG